MPVSERAKQFMPFAAVRGLNEALAMKERAMRLVQRTELSEESAEELNAKMALLHKGSMVSVTYFDNGEHLTLDGVVMLLDEVNRMLCIGDTRIPLDDVMELLIFVI